MKSQFLLLAGLLVACPLYATDQKASGELRPEVSIKELNKNPQRFAGQNVVVTGKIESIQGADAFILNGRGLLNDEILVVVDRRQQAGEVPADQQAGTVPPVIKEKQEVQLTGRVEEIGVAKIEQTYKPGLRPELRAEFRGTVMPVLIVPPMGVKVQG